MATSRFIFLAFLQINLNYFQFKDDELMLQISVSCHDHSPRLQAPGFWVPADCYTNVLQRCPKLNCPTASRTRLLLLWCLRFLNGNATLSGTFHTASSSFSLLSFLSDHPLVNLVLICPPDFWNHLSHCSCPICSSNDLHPGSCNSRPNNIPDSLSRCH